MGMQENPALDKNFMQVKKGAGSGHFVYLLVIYYAIFPMADVISGGLSAYFEVDWFAISYKLGALLVLMIFAMTGSLRKGFTVFSGLIITLLIIGAGARESLGVGGFASDMIFIARGPILLSAVLIVLLSLRQPAVEKVAKAYFISTWITTIFSIIFADLLGVSLSTYDAGYGSKGFYQAANEVTFAFVLSWWFIQVKMAKNLLYSSLLFSATCFLIYMIGTKSGFVLIPILSLWYIVRFFNFNRYLNIIIFIIIALIVSSAAGSIFLAVLPYLPSAEASGFFISRYGVETTLTGGRFADLDVIIRVLGKFSVNEIIFGAGFENFWFSIDGNSVESDLIDTLGGGGIIFAGWFYGMLIWGYLKSGTKLAGGLAVDTAWAFVFIAAVMYSVFVGHIAFAATPLTSIAMFFALSYKEKSSENTNPAVVV